MNKSYSELLKFATFKERFEYLKCAGSIGLDTFGSERYLNQDLYNSKLWRNIRNKIISRDGGFDMGLEGYPANKIVIHHINPITLDDFENETGLLYDPENLICVDAETHRAIHYGSFESIKPVGIIERRPNDTIPWRK